MNLPYKESKGTDSRSEAAAATEEGAAYYFEAVGYVLSFHVVLRELGVERNPIRGT